MPLFPPADPAALGRFARFLVVGGSAAGVQLTVLWLLRPYLPETAAFSVSWVASTGCHYLCNRFWALPSPRRDSARQFGEYLFTVALSYLINVGCFRLGRDVIGLGLFWSTLCAIPPSTIVVFLLLNFRVFRAAR